MMKRQMLLEGILALVMAGCATSASAQPAAADKPKQPADSQAAPVAPAKTAAPTAADAKKADTSGHQHRAGGGGMKGQGMKGGMMGAGMMGGDCPLMAGGDTKMEVKKLAKGVVITLTSDDPAAVTKLQTMAERMQVKHQAHAQ